MIKELYQIKEKTTSLNISANAVDSLMKKHIVKSGCRVYHNGFLGVSGTLGEPDEQAWRDAKDNLEDRVKYPFMPETGRRTRDLRGRSMTDNEFLTGADDFLNDITQAFPGLTLSNKIQIIERETSISNDAGLELVDLDRIYSLQVLVRGKGSVNVFDTGIMGDYRDFSWEEALSEAKLQLNAFCTAVDLPKSSQLPILIMPEHVSYKLSQWLSGEAVNRGSSLFCGKLGQTLFNSALSLSLDRTKESLMIPFFDTEGVSIERYPLIEGGKLTGFYADKKAAEKYGLPRTGSAGGDYDEAPTLSDCPSVLFECEGKSARELFNGELGALVYITSGGDWTNEGDLASPVQLAYLTDGEKLLGRLPEFNISGNLYNILGEGYLGLSSDRPIGGSRALAIRVNVSL